MYHGARSCGLPRKLSGESEAIRNIAFDLNSRGIPIVSLTRYSNNTLAQMSTKNMFVNIREIAMLEETNFESMTLLFLIMEVLFTKFVEYRTRIGNSSDRSARSPR